jgi:hypothetical protein
MEISFRNSSKQEYLKFLEDIPHYQEKLNAYHYVSLDDAQRFIKFAKLKSELNPPYYHEDSAKTDVGIINRSVGFNIASYQRSTTQDRHGYQFIISMQRPHEIKEYIKDVLDADGHVLPSKNQQKAA